MDYQVLITDSALLDLQGIVEFVARDDSAAASCTVPEVKNVHHTRIMVAGKENQIRRKRHLPDLALPVVIANRSGMVARLKP
jgi:hypothetical protein